MLVGACQRQPAPGETAANSAPSTSPPPTDEIFAEVALATGLDFVHDNGSIGELHLSENLGGGAALFDYDNDGDLDIYLVQGHSLAPDPEAEPPTDRLFRNDLDQGQLRFTDVTVEGGFAGPDSRASGYAMGVAAADIDNDGWTDLYVLNFGANQLWRNRGAARGADGPAFEDITVTSGTGDERWSAGASFVDVDRDGRLDLFVANYVDFDPANNPTCHHASSARDYCGPAIFRPQVDRLYLNRSASDEIRFEDVTATAGIARAFGPALGVAATDVDSDGWLDIYVANDGDENQLWVNQGDGTFRDEAALLGVGVNGAGEAEASMGIAVADIDEDGDEDVFLTHLDGETNTLYLNQDGQTFADRSRASGLGPPSLRPTAFGTGFFDADNDGHLDLLVANGAIKLFHQLADESPPDDPLAQPDQLFLNPGTGDVQPRFTDVSTANPAVSGPSTVSRGIAFGDLDNDGDTDAVICANGGRVRLLLNRQGQDRHWIGLRLVTSGGREALGAAVRIVRDSKTVVHRWVRSDGSYASSHDSRVLVGLGDQPGITGIEVSWLSGRHERWTDLAAGTYHTLREGSGDTLQPPK